MPFEPSTLYTTVAQCSATIVAILGGFIASKLITIGSDREEIKSKIKELEIQIDFKDNEIKNLLHEKEVENANYFIKRHINNLIEDSSIDDIYSCQEDYYIEIDALRPYWSHALGLIEKISVAMHEENVEFNEDNVPMSLEKSLTPDDFEIVQRIIKKLNKKNRSSSYPFNVMPDIDYDAISDSMSNANVYYQRRNNKIDDLDMELKFLNKQKKEAVLAKSYFKKPIGMIAGIVILSTFSIFGILLPLIVLMLNMNKVYVYVIVLIMFAVGLGSVVWYLGNLLKWKD